MNIQLVSNDKRVYRALRKALVGLSEITWNLSIVNTTPSPSADLTIWDYESVPSLAGLNQIPLHCVAFIVSRNGFEGLQKQLGGLPVRIVLKPAASMALKSLLIEMVEGVRQRAAESNGKSRHGKHPVSDDLLQYLLEANLRIQEQDQARNRFLSSGVHDIRAPLLAILGYSKLLLKGQVGPLNTEQIEVIQQIQQGVQRSCRLANSLAQAFLSEASTMPPLLKAGDMEESLRQAISEVAPVAEARHVLIETEMLPPLAPLVFDSALIAQVLVNILDDCCRFTPKGGLVSVRGRPVFWNRRAPNLGEASPREERRESRLEIPNAYRVEIRDAGPGIKADSLERMFEDGSSGEPENDFDRPHFGFGLGSCRQILELHGGHIFAEADERGCIVFLLPNDPELNFDFEIQSSLWKQPTLTNLAG